MIAKDGSPGPSDSTRDSTLSPDRSSTFSTASTAASTARSAVEFAHQAEKLSYEAPMEGKTGDVAAEAKFITPQDPVIVTSEGYRLPGVPLLEAHKLNVLKEDLEVDEPPALTIKEGDGAADGFAVDEGQASGEAGPVLNVPTQHGHLQNGHSLQRSQEGSLRRQMPPSHTNPLFPPLPLYGPPSMLRDLQCLTFRISSFFLSLAFLGVIVLGALFTSIAPLCVRTWQRITLRNPDASRPFYEEEMRRRALRQEQARSWKRRRSQERIGEDREDNAETFVPTEGGHDPIKCDVGYYARRVGLDVEEFEVQTEDGFIIDLWHVYDPKEYTKLADEDRAHRGPDLFTGEKKKTLKNPQQKRKFPVLLMHGLLQSAGAYCVNDDDSLAFYLCKAGYDVWLGNNRCGFKPKHVLLEYTDPRMWCWNIRQMGVFDLPALTSRVLYETGFEKIGLICHSQGTTETFVALAKEQRPDLGEKLTVFCALAPAAYAGPLIGKMYFKFMRVITPAMFRLMFGIHAFIPFMLQMHSLLPPRIYGWLGYKVFSFLFNWSDSRWDRELKDRMFQFAPVYVSSESMRWWLGRECFAKHKCILSTKEEWRAEEREDIEADSKEEGKQEEMQEKEKKIDDEAKKTGSEAHPNSDVCVESIRRKPKGSTAWYNEQVPPFALWVAGNDDLVDGNRLLRRFERGREPHVKLVHKKVIEGYEHLDVIWAMDAPDQVFRELKEVLWKTCNARDVCRVPRGCKGVPQWAPAASKREEEEGEDGEEEEQSSSSSEEVPSWKQIPQKSTSGST